MNRISITLIVIFFPLFVVSQITDSLYISPIDYQIKLSGSFGELRSNHFHTGIDIKSKNGRGGDPIFSIADGYVSRIKVNRGGYGQALYIDHPTTGHTSVYAHLKEFNDTISNYISNIQHEMETWEIDIQLKENKIPISKGEVIGILGNSGRSYGPHLHFEIRDTESEKPINPFLFGIKPEDHKSPLVFSVDAFGLDYKNHIVDQQTKYVPKNSKGQKIDLGKFELNSWKAGVGVQVFDQMDGSNNYNGLYELQMRVDDSLLYHFKLDTLSFDESRLINSHIAYACKIKEDRSVTNCFHHKCGKAQYLGRTPSDGIFPIFQDRYRDIQISLIDLDGNKTIVLMSVIRGKGEIASYSYQKYIPCGIDTSFTLLGTKFHFYENSLSQDLPLNYIIEGKFHSISSKEYALINYIDVAIPIESHMPHSQEKLNLACKEKGLIKSFGGRIINDTLYCSINRLGDFFIHSDLSGPKISAEYFLKSSTTATEFRFKISDTPISKGKRDDFTFSVLIDGLWQKCSFKSLDNLLTIPIDHLKKGQHELFISAQDAQGNKETFRSKFVLN